MSFSATPTLKRVDEEPSLYSLLRHFAETARNSPAIFSLDRAPLSFGELWKQIERAAISFHQFGIEHGDVVAVILPSGPEMAVCCLSVACAAVCAPLNPASTDAELRSLLSEISPKAVIVSKASESAAIRAAAALGLPVFRLHPEINSPSGAFRLEGEATPKNVTLEGASHAHDVALLLHTSGSTARPKIVPLTHQNLMSTARDTAAALQLTSDDLCLNLMPLFHSHGFRAGLITSLSVGAGVVCVPGLEAPSFLGWIEKFRPTWYTAVPALHRSILAQTDRSAEGHTRSGLRFIRSASAHLPIDIKERLETTFGVPVIEAYGLTEASDITIAGLLPESQKTGSVGRPVNYEVKIFGENGEALPKGKIGEIVVRGSKVFLGYANDSSSNESAFTNGWFHTGDLGRIDEEGFLFITGRLKETINRGGEKILPWEVDKVLQGHPAIADAVTFGFSDLRLGENVGVAVVLRKGFSATESDILAFAARRLSDFKVPQRVVFVNEIPQGPTGKSLRIGLAERLGISAANSETLDEPFQEPRTETERRLALIWQEVLGLTSVGTRDDFFKLGGDSLLGIQMIGRVREEFGLELPMFSLFTNPRIDALTRWIEGRTSLPGISTNRVSAGREKSADSTPLVQLNQEQLDRIAAGVDGGKENIQDIYPLAPLQEGVFFHHLLGGKGDPYQLVTLYRIHTREKVERYLAALRAIIDRHDILRTSIAWIGLPEPLQIVWSKVSMPVEEFSIDPNAGDVSEQFYAHFDPLNHRVELHHAPMLKVYVAEDKHEGCWRLGLVRHHLVSDHLSTALLRDEIQAHLAGRESELPPPVPFRNLVAQSRTAVSAQEHEEFFKRMLADVTEPTAPFGLTDVMRDGVGIEERRLLVNRELTRRIRATARKLGVSAATICHVAWGQVLAKVSGQDDVVFGTLIFGRMNSGAGAERVMGLSVNTLPLRIRLGMEGAESSVLRTHALLGELVHHEHATLALAQRCSGMSSSAPLFSSLLNYRYGTGASKSNSEEALKVWNGIEVLHLEERTNYPVVMAVDDLGEDIVLVAQTLPAISAVRLCRFMRKALQSLTQTLETAPISAMQTLEVLPDEERRQVLSEFNATDAKLPTPNTVLKWIEQQVDKNPKASALEFEGRRLTYEQLNRRANQLAHYLRAQSVGPDVIVGVFLNRSIEMVVALLGVLKAGAAYLPLDPTYPTDRLAFMLDDAKAAIVLTESDLARELPATNANIFCFDTDSARTDREAETNPGVEVSNESLIYSIYTSGSTGKPKGVGNTQQGVLNRLLWMQGEYQLESTDRVLQKTPYSFDVSVWEFFWSLMVGAELVVAKPEGHKDPAYLVSLIQSQKITTMHFVPSMLRMFLETEGVEGCTSLKRVFCSGEALPVDLQERFFERLKGVELHNLYGPTEAAVDVTYWRCRPNSGLTTVPIGKPIWNTQIYILDKQLQPVPVGVAGELHIGGMGLARGYLNRPELTAEKFIADPFSAKPGARMYKTGDLARFQADGNIEYLGRIDHQVKIRGFRIELGEIESLLEQQHAVADAVVVAREDEPGEKRLVAYLVAAEPTIATQEIREHLKKQLPEYMVPAAFVVLDKMPLTSSGKVDRKSLPAPVVGSQKASEGFVAAKTEVQVLLSQIWAEVLRLDNVSIEDSFFSLGGHSLLAIRAISRVNDTFHTALPIRTLFDSPTISEFARVVEDARGKKSRVAPPIRRASRSEELPLSFAQERLWFLDQFAPGDVSYNVAVAVEIDGALNVAALERSFQEIVNRHESLRTRFLAVDGKPRQIIDENVVLKMAVLDLSHLAAGQRNIEVERLAKQEARKPFDLSRSPLLRVTLLQQGEKDHILLLTMHHIASDGWSMEVVFPELSSLYQSFCSNESASLPAIPIQYADFGIWQRNWMKGEVLEEQLAYWKKQLEGAEALELPADRPRPAVRGNAGAYLPIEISAETLSRLKELSRKAGTTLYMTLLAAFATLLHRYSGQEDIVVGSPAAGRTRTETEHLIGFFVNTLALRTKIHSDMSFTSLLKSVKETTLDAYTHQDVPFEKLVEMLAPQRDLSRTPIFQVMFALQNAALPQLRLGDAKLSAEYGDTGTSKFDLTMNLEELHGAIQGRLTYSTELFDEPTISRMLNNFKTMLNGIVASPELPIANLPILDEKEKKEIIFGFNAAPSVERTSDLPLDGRSTLNALFEKQVSRNPGAVALSCDGQSLTYAELNSRANRIAHRLVECGVKPDTLVGLCVDRNNDVVIGILGILKSGGAYLPMDLAYPADRLAFMMEDAQAPVMLTQRSLLARLPLTSAKVICLDDVLAEAARNGEESNLGPTAGPDNLAYVIYTSGTTGKPKGSLITHRNVVRLFPATEHWYQFNDRDVWTLFHSSAFDFSVWEIWGALLYGGRVVVVPYLVSRSPEAFYELLSREGVTVLNQTPSAFRQLIQAEEAVGQKKLALRYVIFGGEALEMRSLQPWFNRHGDQTPKLVNMYGITETTVHVTYRPLSKDDVDSGSVIGVPIPDLQIYILDSHQQPVPVGVPGEMYVGGAGLARGYLRRPDLTNERFVADCLTGQNGTRLYRTGDLARFLPGRDIEYLGRVDQQVKIRGFRIELGEIESVLCEQPEIREAAVVARDVFGAKGLVAYLVADAPHPGVFAVRDSIKKQLPDYMVPNAFVFLERMPLTASGKIDRKALPDPQKQASNGHGQYVAPQSAMELTIADVWQRLFGTERVSIEENFFDLGGHSLLMIQLHSRLKTALNKEFSIVTLFEHPTIRSLARHLSSDAGEGHADENSRRERAQRQKQSRELSRSKALKRNK